MYNLFSRQIVIPLESMFSSLRIKEFDKDIFILIVCIIIRCNPFENSDIWNSFKTDI